MLAFVFWSIPVAEVAQAEFETALGEFHAGLRRAPCDGQRGTMSYRTGGLPWLQAGVTVFEDWNLLRGFDVLDRLVTQVADLDHDATSAHRRLARWTRDGAGGVLSLRAGRPQPGRMRYAWWPGDAKPAQLEAGVAGFRKQFPDVAVALWTRTLGLGPARCCLQSSEDLTARLGLVDDPHNLVPIFPA
jgi:hypothetical protein